jgi:uncharacterized membrane protein
VIERYLDEIARRLPRLGRRRILAELEDHLRESADVHGEEEAIRRFGSPEEVARGFRRPSLLPYGLIVAALVLAFLAMYPIPENTLPPAPWPGNRPPDYLHWKQEKVAQLFLLAVVAAFGSVFVLRRLLMAVALAALAAMTLIGAVLAYEWQQEVPGAPGLVWILPYALVELALLAAAAYSATAPRAHALK